MIEIGVDPVAFTIGSLSIRWYGVFIALAIVWLVVWLVWQSRRGARITYDTVFTAALVGIPSGIIISRLLHVLDNIVVAKLHPELTLIGAAFDYTQDPARILGAEGLTAYGAVLGASLGVWVYCRVAKVRIGYFFDLVAPAVIVAQAVIGRIGCTLNGCCYGLACSLPWGTSWTHPDSLGPATVSVHPTQVYEIILGLVVFGVLVKLRGRFKPDGSLFLIYLGLYAAWRLGIDFMREGNPFLLDLHQAQFISIIVLLIVTPLLVRRTRWVGKNEQALTDEPALPVPEAGEPEQPEERPEDRL